MGHGWGPVAVGWVAWTTAGLALVAPRQMLALWPARRSAPERLMQGWALSTLGLATTLWGAPPALAASAVCVLSIPWDLDWGGPMGTGAAVLNGVCAGCLCPSVLSL